MKYKPIGEIIKQKFDESGMKKKEFADKIGCERSDVYYLFSQYIIDIEKLEKISEALNYDFMYEVYNYKKQYDTIATPTQTVFIAVEVDIERLQQLNLPDDFIRLIKEQKQVVENFHKNVE